jgi:histidinol phosphatase-like enzyme (inositol monophosphatase family)
MTTPPTIPAAWAGQIEGRLATALELAQLAGDVTLSHFQDRSLEWERKQDDSPVTVADKAAEKAIRERVSALFPNDAIEGEEFGGDSRQSDAEFAWIVDPIDGTKSFLSGVPLYSTLVGLTRNGEPFAGVINIPALGEIVIAAQGLGCWYSAGGKPFVKTQVSAKTKLSDSLFVLSQSDSFGKYASDDIFQNLQNASYITRTWGDGYGYLLIATGRAELMVDPVVNAWDVAAVLPVIEEAGGQCTDWRGQRTIRGGNMVATNGNLHSVVLEMLQPTL